MMLSRGTLIGVIAMAVIVVASNVLVQYPINDWLTWGAFTYPAAFLVTDLTNRALGPSRALGGLRRFRACRGSVHRLCHAQDCIGVGRGLSHRAAD